MSILYTLYYYGLISLFTFLHAIYWSSPPIWHSGRLNKQSMIRSGTHLPSNYKTAYQNVPCCDSALCQCWLHNMSDPTVWLLWPEASRLGIMPKKKPVILLLSSRKWLETDFQDMVRCRRAAVASKTCRAAAMSLANGIVAVLKAWNGICGPDEVFSMAVLCTGEDAAKHNAWQNVQISAVILTDPARVGMWSSFGYLRRVLRSPRWHRPLSSNHLRRR